MDGRSTEALHRRPWRTAAMARRGGTMANAGDDLGDSITGSDKHRCTTAVLAHQLSRGMVDYHGVAMTTAMAELWQRHTRGGAKRSTAYQWRGCGRSKVGTVE